VIDARAPPTRVEDAYLNDGAPAGEHDERREERQFIPPGARVAFGLIRT
jgi:hypothetical protein